MPRYLEPDATITLAEGLDEYRREFPEIIEAFEPNSSGEQMLDAHDVAHVVFGCTTCLRGEVLVHAWTVFGTTQTLRQAHAATREDEHRSVFGSLGWKATPAILRALPLVGRVALRARRMTCRWPFTGFESHLGRPLGALRREFGIEILR